MRVRGEVDDTWRRQRRLLERGVRADSNHEGQGLGLAVAAEIVRSYNGTIELGRADNGGARVIVRIPLS